MRCLVAVTLLFVSTPALADVANDVTVAPVGAAFRLRLREDVFEAEARHGVRRQSLERHVLEQIRRESVKDAIGGKSAFDGTEPRAVLVQRLRQAAH